LIKSVAHLIKSVAHLIKSVAHLIESVAYLIKSVAYLIKSVAHLIKSAADSPGHEPSCSDVRSSPELRFAHRRLRGITGELPSATILLGISP